jgi:DNA invertase Pin-like site-specific DNA recombinase
MAGRTCSTDMATVKDQPVAGYIRVSRIGGCKGEGYISPDGQRTAIEGYAAELGLRIAADAWDRSGGNFDRPGWERIVKRIESEEVGGVIVLRVDRFARNVPDGATQIRHIVDECGAIFGSAIELMDPSTPAGRYMLQQFLNNAELQIEHAQSELVGGEGKSDQARRPQRSDATWLWANQLQPCGQPIRGLTLCRTPELS